MPSRCAICHDWPARPVCSACVREFTRPVARCPHCALPLADATPGDAKWRCGACEDASAVLDEVRAAVTYAYPWDYLLRHFKFHGATGWASAFAERMRSVPEVPDMLAHANHVIAMPLSDARMRARGFNQSALLASALCRHKLRAGMLVRTRDTPAQSGLALHDRLRNVQGVYAVPATRRMQIAGKRITLVDDVMTSGASLRAAADALLEAGAARVSALVFARAE